MLRRSKSVSNLSFEDERRPLNSHESRRLGRFENPQSGSVKINRWPRSSANVLQLERRRLNQGLVNNSETKLQQTQCIYEGIPQQLLFCSFCDKKCSSPRCFEEHVKSKCHRRKMASLPAEFSADIQRLRNDICSAMSSILAEYDGESTRFCVMCRVHYPGNISEHREWSLHVKLRNFLHPECTLCGILCKTRSEYLEHTLTPSHLMNLAKHNGRTMGTSSPEESQDFEFDVSRSFNTNGRQSVQHDGDETLTKGLCDSSSNKEDSNVDTEDTHEGMQNVEDTLALGCEAANFCTRTESPTPGNESPTHFVDEEGYTVPIYKEHLTYGQFMIQPRLVCVCCKYVLKEDEVVEVHARTRKHYENYVNAFKRHIRRNKVAEISPNDSKQLNRSRLEEPDIPRLKRLKRH